MRIESRKKYPDILRVLASLGVVLIHVTANVVREYNDSNTMLEIVQMLNQFVRWSVPIFFMISGMFFLSDRKEYTMKEILKGPLAKLIIYIFVWGFIYSVIDIYFTSSFTWKSFFVILLRIGLGKTGYHLWFLYSLATIYLTVPYLRILVQKMSRRQYEFLLLLWLVLFVCVRQANSFSQMIGWESISFNYTFPMITDYLGFFLLGDYLNRFSFSALTKKILILSGSLLLFIGIGANAFFTLEMDQGINFFTDERGIAIVFASVALFLMFQTFENKKSFGAIRWISKYTLGIYLIHPAIISVMDECMPVSLLEMNPLLYTFLSGILVFSSSMLIVFVMKKIPGIKKLV